MNGGSSSTQKFIVNPWTHEVEVPDDLGFALLRSGAGAIRIDLEPPPEPEGECVMEHNDFQTSISFRGRTYPAEQLVLRDGRMVSRVLVPVVAVTELLSHGFRPIALE